MNPFQGFFRYFRVFRRYIGRRLYVVFALSVAAALMEGLGISLLLPLLQAVQGNAEPDSRVGQWLFDGLGLFGIENSIPWIMIFIGCVFFAKAGFNFFKDVYTGHLRSMMFERLKGQIYDDYSVMSYQYYAKNSSGYFINVLNQGVGQFFGAFAGMMGFLTKIIMAFVYIGFAFFIAWHFALLAVLAGAALPFLFKLLNNYVQQLSRKATSENAVLNKLLIQSLQAFKYIVSTGEAGRMKDGVMRSIRRLRKYQFRKAVAGAFSGSIQEPLAISVIIAIVLFQLLVLHQPLAPIFVAIILINRSITTAMGIQGAWQGIMSASGGLELVDEEFARLAEHRERGGTRELGPLSEGIQLREVSFEYSAQSPVLHGVDVRIPRNTTVAFVGESGAGKSTLIDLLTLLLKPTSGELTIDGISWREVELASWRKQIGYVSQDTVVFDDTIANNIAMWAEPKSSGLSGEELHECMREAARKAHLAHFIEGLPEGYETVVGERGIRLSGGQKQRLFIARELFKQPNLLILDEATSALDTDSEKAIQRSIDELKGTMTVVIIAHRLSTIRNVDYLYVLDHGRILEEGTYAELRDRSEGRFREMVELQTL